MPRHVSNSGIALLELARLGEGLVLLEDYTVHNDIQQGRLVRVLADWAPRREVIHLVFPSRRGMLPAVRALIDFLAEQYAAFAEE